MKKLQKREEVRTMRSLSFRRFKNKYLLISILALFFVLLCSFLIHGGIIEILCSDYSSDASGGLSEYQLKKHAIDSVLYWEFWILDGVWYNENIFPIYAMITALPFLLEIDTFFKLGANRFSSRRKELGKSIASYGLMGGLSISLGFLLYFLVGCYFCLPQMESLGGFESIFHYSLYREHPFLFLCFMDFTIYFLFGVLFAIMACGTILCFHNKLTAILLPMFVYVVGSYIGEGFGIRILQISSCTTVFCTNTTTGQCFVPLISLVIIDVLLLIFGVRKNEKIVL